MKTTSFVYAPAAGHTLRNHPESYARLAGILPFLERNDGLQGMHRLEPQRASVAQVRRVHSADHLQRLAEISSRGGGRIDADTYVTGESYELALLAAGSAVVLVDSVLSGGASNGLAMLRPPGHHAGRNRAEGFCLLNNVAVAARHAQEKHGLSRILIVDVDVHHGNGTQDIFYEDDQILFASLHMHTDYFYPGLGSARELGSGSGRDYTLNIPFPPGVGDVGYLLALRELLLPKAAAFQPEIVLVSTGFDAHWRDPLAAAGLSLTGFDEMFRFLLELAAVACEGRIIFVLEGGYFQDALHYGLLNLCRALTGREGCLDPLGAYPAQETDVTGLLSALKALHLLS